MLEKLQLTEEKNLLIQGLPSSIEKQFAKIAFAKNVTPLLKARRIDFALVFAINENQLNNILSEVLPALDEVGKLWVAYPKTTSKIVSDLNRDCNWDMLCQHGYENECQVTLDHVWAAIRFIRATNCEDAEDHQEDEDTLVVATSRSKRHTALHISSASRRCASSGK